MNACNAHLYLPSIQALAAGQIIEVLNPATSDWSPSCELDFNLPPDHYRVMKEPWRERFDTLVAKEALGHITPEETIELDRLTILREEEAFKL